MYVPWFAILEAALFNAKSEINRLEKKEDLRKITENHLHESRKEVILQGELLRKYHERFMGKPVASEQEQKSLYKQAFKHQVEALKGELTMKSSEVEALVSTNVEERVHEFLTNLSSNLHIFSES